MKGKKSRKEMVNQMKAEEMFTKSTDIRKPLIVMLKAQISYKTDLLYYI